MVPKLSVDEMASVLEMLSVSEVRRLSLVSSLWLTAAVNSLCRRHRVVSEKLSVDILKVIQGHCHNLICLESFDANGGASFATDAIVQEYGQILLNCKKLQSVHLPYGVFKRVRNLPPVSAMAVTIHRPIDLVTNFPQCDSLETLCLVNMCEGSSPLLANELIRRVSRCHQSLQTLCLVKLHMAEQVFGVLPSNLKGLSIHESKIPPGACRFLVRSVPQLEQLGLSSNSAMTPECLEILGNLQYLEELGCNQPTIAADHVFRVVMQPHSFPVLGKLSFRMPLGSFCTITSSNKCGLRVWEISKLV